jgi:hypothetical protein
MRSSLVVLGLVAAGAAFGAAGPRITPKDVARHRAQLVTLVGEVTEIGGDGSDVLLRVGGVAVRVPDAARPHFRRDPKELLDRTVEITGFVSPPGRPLAVVLERPEELVVKRSRADASGLAARIRALEEEVARLRASAPQEGETGVVYGPTSPPILPLPRHATQTTVLAERGVPTRVEWSNQRRVLWYGREAWSFDEEGQLIDVRDQ